MPCYTIQTASIDLGAIRPQVLSDALEGLGLVGGVLTTSGASGRLSLASGGSVYVSGVRYAGGALSVSGTSDVAGVTAAVKRAYTQTLVTQQAKRFGWRVKQGQGGKLLLQK
jgi:hypothetical protein